MIAGLDIAEAWEIYHRAAYRVHPEGFPWRVLRMQRRVLRLHEAAVAANAHRVLSSR